MTRPDDLVRLLRSGESARPRLIWYAPGERIELSGRVLATWAAKAADLLQEELDAEVGTRVGLVGTPHWRLIVWALATWNLGGTVVLDDDAGVDVLVLDGHRLGDLLHGGTWSPGDPATRGAEHVVALTRAALARRSPVALPDGVIDEAAILLTHADEMDPLDTAADDDTALVDDAATSSYADLVAAASPARAGAGDGTGGRDAPTRRHVPGSIPLAEVLRTAVATWATGGSIVLTDPEWEADQGGDPSAPAFARVLESEGVSAPRA